MPTETDVVELSTPLPLPCGQTLPNRVMKAALSRALGLPSTHPIPGSKRCTAVGARVATDWW